MGQYVIRRLLWFIPVLFLVSVIIFVIMRVVPGDPVIAALGGEASVGLKQEQIDRIRQQLGLDRSLVVQYKEWAWGMLRLDPGVSLRTRQPVGDDIRRKLPLTLELTLASVIIGMVFAIPIGVISAVRRNSIFDYVLRLISGFGLAIPSFFLGTLIIIFLVRQFTWLPPLGYKQFWVDPIKNIAQIMIPASILGFILTAFMSRMTRSQMLEVVRQDYIRTAWSKGLRERTVIIRHALKNAIIPVVTLSGVLFATLLSGTVIMEDLFSVPGIGQGLATGVRERDYTMVQAIVVLYAVMILVVNLLVDLTYAWLDPRIRY